MKKGMQNQTNPNGLDNDREMQVIDNWMQRFATSTAPPENLPAPGFLLFKARLLEKRSAAARAVQLIVRMQIFSAIAVALAVIYMLTKSRVSVVSILNETFVSLGSVAWLVVFSLISAALICLAFAYFLRETKELKNKN